MDLEDELESLFHGPAEPSVKVAQSLDVSIEEYDERVGPQREVSCPDCTAPMRLKESKYGWFYGCTEFSSTGCKGTVKATPSGMLAAIPAPQRTRFLRGEIMRRIDALVAAGTVVEKDRGRFVRDLTEKTLGGRFQGVGSFNEHEALKVLEALIDKNPTQWDVLDGPGIV